jgi:ABC-type nitrate/sulfonate/bicarbonate transport system substrate-binding protein
MRSSALPLVFSARRRALRAVLAAPLLSAGLGAVQAAEPVTLRLGAPYGAVPGIKTAIEEGDFEREGIRIQLVTLAGGPAILAATVGGSLEIGYADLFAWAGSVDNGFKLAFLQPANGRGSIDYIVAGADSGIKTPQDLKGKKIGVAAHAQSKLRVSLYLKRFGVAPGDVQFVVINQRDTVGAALANRQIDAAIAPDPDVAQWQQEYRIVALPGRPWEQIPTTATTAGFFATQDWYARNPDLARRFARAARQGAARYNAYSAEQKAKISLKYDKLDLFALEKKAPGVLKRMDDAHSAESGPIDVAATKQWLDMALANGTIRKGIDLESLLAPTATVPTL